MTGTLKGGLQLLQEPFGDRGEGLKAVPRDEQPGLQRRIQQPEHQAAPFGSIDQVTEGQEIPEPLPCKNGTVIGKPERPLQIQL